MECRVRFAPSPTGQVHIGNIRTAIFNWLFARHAGGSFLLRIEDTDLERSTRAAIDTLLECMDWLGLNYDGEILYQTAQRPAHEAAAQRLLAENKAYYGKIDENGRAPVLFRIPFAADDIPAVRTVGPAEVILHPEEKISIAYSGVNFATVSKKGKPVPESACLAGFKDLKLFDAAGTPVFDLNAESNAIKAGKRCELSGGVRMTFTRREVFFHDLIKGELSKPLDGMKDPVIRRSDGSPVFHLANVCDDILQKIDHIIRGDDHVENTYRHILLYHALGAPVPHYAHLPMLVNQAGKPYSKRDGDAFVGDFRQKGFLPEALFNYLALLGWSPGDGREKMTRSELAAAFTLDRVKSSPAQFDLKKLLNLNGMYIAELPFDKFCAAAAEFAAGFEWGKAVGPDKFSRVAALMQSRTKDFTQIENWKYFFSADFDYDPKQLQKQFGDEQVRAGLTAFAAELAAAPELSAERIAGLLAAAETEHGLEPGKLFAPLRLAVTGVGSGAELDETILLIGAPACRDRIGRALEIRRQNL
ncbi:MAG: glutamate--tRNA ligase family protein [Victivallaceae bacterium]|nr:glutamate--tRNA ligase family protein [Victivallaceae bacterium]